MAALLVFADPLGNFAVLQRGAESIEALILATLPGYTDPLGITVSPDVTRCEWIVVRLGAGTHREIAGHGAARASPGCGSTQHELDLHTKQPETMSGRPHWQR